MRALAALLAAWLLHAQAAALAPSLRLDQLQHTTWLVRDGAPTDIHAIRQTPDGNLWLGTGNGLVRFDGVQFERIDLFPSGGGPGLAQNIASLMVDREGWLWIGFRLAGVLGLGPGGQRRWYDWTSGLSIGTVFALAQDGQGALWAATSRGVFTLQGERWALQGADQGLQPGHFDHLLVDGGQTLWAHAAGHRWFSRAPGAARFQHRPALDGVRDATVAADGRLMLLDADGRLRPLDAAPGSGQALGARLRDASLLADPDGGFWLVHDGTGLTRLAQAAVAPERKDRQAGLSGDRASTGYIDREGHLWVGTSAGLDHLRPPRAVLVPLESGADSAALVADADGSVVAASVQQTPTRLRVGAPPQRLPGDFTPAPGAFGAAGRDPDGTLWFGAFNDLWQLRGGRLQRLPGPPDLPPNRPVQAVGRDAAGTLWAAWVPGPLRRHTGHGWAPPADDERAEIVMVLHNDAGGGFWRGLTNGEVVRRAPDGSAQRWGRAQGMALGMVLCIQTVTPAGGTTPAEVWVGGEQGVALLAGGRVLQLTQVDGQPLRSVSGLLLSADGALWLNEASGILRIGPTQLAAWRARPDGPVTAARLDWRDGVLGGSPQFRQLPSAVAARDGRLWFSRGQGLYWVDPAAPARALPLPPVQITGVWADGQRLAHGPGPAPVTAPATGTAATTRLPVAAQALRIGFAVPLPGAALQLRYRARLLGMDDAWQDLGARRELQFSRLPPGDYQLELQAQLGEQSLSPVTSLALRVPPALHQTLWFRALAALALLALGVALYRWRVAAHCRRVQERTEAQLAERERIARELHDTLLQGTQALSLQIEAGLQDLGADDPRRRQLQTALDRADAALAEARDRVQDLRRHQQPAELLVALRDAVLALRGAQPSPAVHAERYGAPRPLATAVWHEAFRLGLEAAQNTLRHARASVLRLGLRYDRDALVLTVADDGVGLGGDPASSDGQPAGPAHLAAGHFGLRGLHERARLMGGTLQIDSAPGAGAQVRLRVPASGAYAGQAGWPSLRDLVRRPVRWPALRRPPDGASSPG